MGVQGEKKRSENNEKVLEPVQELLGRNLIMYRVAVLVDLLVLACC